MGKMETKQRNKKLGGNRNNAVTRRKTQQQQKTKIIRYSKRSYCICATKMEYYKKDNQKTKKALEIKHKIAKQKEQRSKIKLKNIPENRKTTKIHNRREEYSFQKEKAHGEENTKNGSKITQVPGLNPKCPE